MLRKTVRTVLVGLLIALAGASWASAKTLSGHISDQVSGAPIEGVNVTVLGTYLGTASDRAGRYLLSLPPGSYTIVFSHVRFEQIKRPVRITVRDSMLLLDVKLREKVEQLGVITVQAGEEKGLSEYHIKLYSAQNLPALGEADALRLAAMLPGVMQANDYRDALNIHGGHSDQTQYLLDDVEIFHPRHLKGLFSAFNMLAIDDINVYTANFPARYAGRLSGVLALKTIGDMHKTRTKANISLITAGFSSQTSRDKFSVLLAARRTYLDFLTALIGSKISYGFYDFNLKAQYRYSEHLKTMVGLFRGRDGFNEPGGKNSDWGNNVAYMHVDYNKGRYLNNLLTWYSQKFTHTGQTGSSSNIRNTLTDIGIRFHGKIISTYNIFKYGIRLAAKEVAYGWKFLSGEDISAILYKNAPAQFDHKKKSGVVDAWIADRFLIDEDFSTGAKLHYLYYQNRAGYVAPGIDLEWRAHELLRFNLSFEKTYQFLASAKDGIEFSFASPFFLLRQPMAANIFSLGLMGKPLEWLNLKTAFYYKNYNNIVHLQNDAAYPSFERGSGVSYGVDLMLEKNIGRLTFQLNYSHDQTRVKFSAGQYTPEWEIPNAFKGTVGIRFGRTWMVTSALTYRSGNLYRRAVGAFFGPGGSGTTDYDRSNYQRVAPYFIKEENPTARFSPYFRLDLALRKKYSNRYFNWTLFLQVQNITFKTNGLRVSWQDYYLGGSASAQNGIIEALPILPSIGALFDF